MWALHPASSSSPEALADEHAPRGRTLREEAVARYNERRYFQAIELGERALEAADKKERDEILTLLARFQSALGVELFNAGEYRSAEEAFQKALVRADDSYAHFGLGFLRFLKLDHEKARTELEAALHLEPQLEKALKLLGVMDYREGNTQAALDRIREAAKLDPADKEARALLERWQREAEITAIFRASKRPGFELRIDPALPSATVDVVLVELTRARRELDEVGMAPAQALTVVLYSESKFHQATGSLHWIAGVYDGQIKLPVAAGKLEGVARDELRRSLRHELAHAAIREIGPECPNWLNEGIAQHFEGAQDPAAWRAELKKGAARRLSLRSVPTRLWEVEDEALARWTYLQGLGFVELLVERHQEFRLRLLLRALAREGSVARAFEVTYGASLEALESALWVEVVRE